VNLDGAAADHDPLDQEAQQRLAAGVIEAIESLGDQLAVGNGAGVAADAGGGLGDGGVGLGELGSERSSSWRRGASLASNMDLVSPSDRYRTGRGR